MEKRESTILQLPEIDPFQFHTGQANGDNTVNLFRGDVVFQIPLVYRKGRNGLDISISARYCSNVSDTARHRSLEAPVSVMGLGFGLPLERIEMVRRKGADARIYYLVRAEARTRLYRNSRRWLRGSVAQKYRDSLCQGRFTQELQIEFLQQGIGIADPEHVHVENGSTEGTWKLLDTAGESVFLLEDAGDGISVYAGGESYELLAYDYSRIFYYKEFEKWEVTDIHGVLHVFGGDTERNQATGWAVTSGGWQIPGIVTHTKDGGARIQSREAVSWYWTGSRSVYGDTISYQYTQIQQQVGDNGLSYTKEIYLERVLDTFDNEAVFVYKDKQYGQSPDQPREYADYYKPFPDTRPDAYQSKYETKYLDAIQVYDGSSGSGRILYTLQFAYGMDYYYSPARGLPAGDMYKRTLTAIEKRMGSGESLPGIRLEYYGRDEKNAGAIKRIIYPEGCSVQYEYLENALNHCSRNIQIHTPCLGAVPRVWFGNDYAVVTWHTRDRLLLEIYTWVGGWKKWTPKKPEMAVRIAEGSLNCLIQEDYFILYFDGQNKSNPLNSAYVYHKDPFRLGEFIEQDSLAPLVTAYREEIHYSAGDDFFAVNRQDDKSASIYIWDPLACTWKRSEPDFSRCQALVQSIGLKDCHMYSESIGNIHIQLLYDQIHSRSQKRSHVFLYILDSCGHWQSQEGMDWPDLEIYGNDPATGHKDLSGNFKWCLLPWAAAASWVTGSSQAHVTCQAAALQWTDHGQLKATEGLTAYAVPKNKHAFAAVPYHLSALSDSMLMAGTVLFRYNGREWLSNSSLDVKTAPEDDTLYWFGPGEDIVMKTENNSKRVVGEAVYFDPNTDSFEWSRKKALCLYDGVPQKERLTSYYSSAAAHCATWDTSCYKKEYTSDWGGSLKAQPFYQVPAGSDTTTIINQDCGYLVYQEKDKSGSRITGTRFITLNNGRAETSELIRENYISLVSKSGELQPDRNGKLPGGGFSFLTYLPLDCDFDHAQDITIHRYVGAALQKPVIHYPAVRVTIDNGFKKSITRYEFIPEHAVCDNYGMVAKYYKSCQYKGDGASNGHTCYYFYNMLETARMSDTVQKGCSLLDGTLYRREVYDGAGRMISSANTDYEIVRTVAAQPGAEPCTPIYGALLRPSRVRNEQMGAGTESRHFYDGFSGMQSRLDVSYYNAQGCLQTNSEQKTYAGLYPEYEFMTRLNWLSMPVETKKTVSMQGQMPVTVTCQTITLKLFSAEDGSGRMVPGPDEKHIWLNEPEKERWLKAAATARLSTHGSVLELQSPIGRITSKLFDRQEKNIVASFSNASLSGQEAYYYGFEPYEDPGIWDLADESAITDAVSCTGTRCLCIKPGADIPALSLSPSDQDREYLFSCQGKVSGQTKPGAGTAASGWKLCILEDGKLVKEDTLAFHKSGGWEYYFLRTDLRMYSGKVRLEFRPFNDGETAVYCDHVGFAPFENPYTAIVYDALRGHMTASAGPYEAVTHTLRDSFGSPAVQTGTDGRILEITIPFLSRMAYRDFHPAEPNSMLSVRFMGSTCLDRFHDTDLSPGRWKTEQPQDWHSVKGKLVHTSSGYGKITFTEPGFTSRYGAYLQFEADSICGLKAGLNVGNDFSVEWAPESGQWDMHDSKNSVRAKSTCKFPSPCGSWMLILSEYAVLFFVNGRKVFDYLPKQMISGMLSVYASQPAALSCFAAGKRPQTGICFYDGSGREVQGQALEGTDVAASQIVYDEDAIPVIRTLPAVLSGLSSVLSYCQDAVTELDWESGVMKGRIADCYPQTEGYPYQRTVLEASPLRRTVTAGLPGKDFAVIKGVKTHTVNYTYGVNDDTNPDYPAGRYLKTTIEDQNGNVRCIYRDTMGNEVCRDIMLDDGKVIRQSSFTDYASGRKTVTVRLPNYYNPPAGSVKENWTEVRTYDCMGKMVRSERNGRFLSSFIYNSRGWLRFSQNAAQADQKQIVYKKYDSEGRLLEEGLLASEWDAPMLKEKAENCAEWPDAADGARKKYRYSYHGDGTRVHDFGNLTGIESFSLDQPGVRETVTTLYYDAAQKIQKVAEETAGGVKMETSYEYDNLGNPDAITYPSGLYIRLLRDESGRIAAIAGADGRNLAEYTYTAQDRIAKTASYLTGSQPLTTQYRYSPQGWLLSTENSLLEETLTYTDNGYGGKGYYNGLIASKTVRVKGKSGQDEFTFRYGYDKADRLTAAEYSAAGKTDPKWSIGTTSPVTYDDNGNFLSMDGKTYKYEPGTDQVRNTDGSDRNDYIRDKNGSVISSRQRNITALKRDLYTGKPNRIELNGQEALDILYNAKGGRLYKSSKEKSLYYGRDMSGLVLSETETQNSLCETTDYIYGPDGMLGFLRAKNMYAVVTDGQKSPLAVIGQDGMVKETFRFDPYGNRIGQDRPDGTDQSLLRYLFCGYEYDAETGLYHTGARLYDSILAGFYEADPKNQYPSPYLFTGCNPVNMIDENGESANWLTIAGAILGTITAIALTVLTAGAAGEALAGMIGADAAAGAATVAAGSVSETLINMGVAAAIGTVSAAVGDLPGMVAKKISAKQMLTDGLIGAGTGAVFAGASALIGRALYGPSQAAEFASEWAELAPEGVYSEVQAADKSLLIGIGDSRLTFPDSISGVVSKTKGGVKPLDRVAIHGLPGRVMPEVGWDASASGRSFADFLYYDKDCLLARRVGPVKAMICYAGSNGPNGEKCVAQELADRFKREVYAYPNEVYMYEDDVFKGPPENRETGLVLLEQSWDDYKDHWQLFKPGLFHGHFGRFGFFGI